MRRDRRLARALESGRRLAAGDPLDAAARLRGVDGVPSGRVLDALRAARAADAGEFRARLGGGAVRALFPQHFMLVTLVLAAQLVLCTLAAYAFARYEFFGSASRSRWCWCS
jgi:ABC-type glycerol-3-phosphate transport system permease component